MHNYNHNEIESKWQKRWQEADTFKIQDSVENKQNKYILVEFPYPSGNLHVGHWYAFAVTDIYARYQRMLGYNVLFPVGFDAFGLPAENAAIKRNLNPREWTYSNMESMKKQMISMGASFDWSRLVATCDPEYYKWTQWMFIQFFNKGLAYQKDSKVNWCPSCKTVLANEQIINSLCERCDSEVIQKDMNQWFFKITEYADRLVDDLDTLDEWDDSIKNAQKNWIGRKEGAEIDFKIKTSDDDFSQKITIFTTRPDTLFGVSYLVIAPDSDYLKNLKSHIENIDEVNDYVKETSKKTELDRQLNNKEKTGIKLVGITAVNPINDSEIPVFIADYVLSGFGTGAVMAVPAHDERDFEFANKFNLPKIQVIKGGNISEQAFTEHGILINSAEFDGKNSQDVFNEITEQAYGRIAKNYRLRDWLISRQRYWGCPIPIVHCQKCGAVPEKEENLPIELPEIDNYLPRDDGKSPLAKAKSWVKTKCPQCNGDAERETDTLDAFVDSSWYYLRYTDSNNSEKFADENKIKKWMPIDFYSGGSEHTTIHLLFTRFFYKVLFDLDYVKNSEPFNYRLNRGLILGPDGNKMSKSKGNVIDPDELVERLGSDTVRLYLAFIGPYGEAGSYPWDLNGVVGTRRFLEKVVRISQNISDESSLEVKQALNKNFMQINKDIEELKFNTCIASLMKIVNHIEKGQISKEDFGLFLKVLSPFAPHLADELYEKIGNNDEFLVNKSWPEIDPTYLEDETIKLAVQVNGKVRTIIEIEKTISEKTVQQLVLANPVIKKWIEGKNIKKFVYVEGKIVNIVI